MKTMRLLAFALLALLMSACVEFHTSENGKLDGFWQLTQVDTLENGISEDMTQRMIFWSVQSKLLLMQDRHDMTHAYLGIYFHFEHEGDKLCVYDPTIDNRLISDSVVTEVRMLSFYGVYHLREEFRVLRLESTKMTLENERLRMHFRKF